MQHPSIGSRHIRLLACVVLIILITQASAFVPLLPAAAAMAAPYAGTLGTAVLSWSTSAGVGFFASPFGSPMITFDSVADLLPLFDQHDNTTNSQITQQECTCPQNVANAAAGATGIIAGFGSVALDLFGYTNKGVRVGSYAAGQMSEHGDVAKGSWVSMFQSWGTYALSPKTAITSLAVGVNRAFVWYYSPCKCF